MYKHILVPLDGSKLSESALPHARICASGCQQAVEITFVQVIEPLRIYEGLEQSLPMEQKEKIELEAKSQAVAYLNKIAASFAGDKFNVNTKVLSGPIAESIVGFAKETGTGLIIIGTHGNSGVKSLLLGSVAQKVLSMSPVPVLMAREPEA